MLDSKVTFKIDAKNGMEYFEQDGYPVGTEHKVPWIYDPISKIYSAQVILRTVTMTSLFKQDIVTAFYPGLSSGKLYIEVIQDAPEIR